MSSSSSPRRSGPRRSSPSASPSSIRRRSSSRTTRSNPRRPSSPSPSRQARKRFGLNVPVNQPRFVGRFDFEDKYPLDPIYEEMGPNARVWRVNLDECEVYDNDMVTEARDGLDLLLVFAGLFSAVLTTFVAQTSQSLSNNFVAVSTSLLVEMVTLQRAQINGASIDSIPSSDITAGPSGFDVWVNALWFTSLTLSLGTALMAVLVKQWLYQYMSITSGTARDRTLIRFYRFDGLRKWHVLTIISTLPIVLHIALGLFLAGLVVFLIPLNIPLACIIGFITLVIYIMYAISNILPVIYTQCPYRTPSSDILNIVIRVIRTLPSLALARIRAAFTSTVDDSTPVTTDVFRTLKDAERIAATNDEVAESLAYDALMWLYQATSNPPTKNVILQSLGCFSDDVRANLPSMICDDLNQSIAKFINKTAEGNHIVAPPAHTVAPGREHLVGMLMRANDLNSDRRFFYMAPWKFDTSTLEWPFQELACFFTCCNVYSAVDMESKTWRASDLLVHFIKDPNSISLPPLIWRRLFELSVSDGFRLPGVEDDNFLVSLCQLGIQNFASDDSTPASFSGGVPMTHGAVPLLAFVSDLLIARLGHVNHDPPGPVARLFIIHDFVMSFLPPMEGDKNSQSVFHGATQALTDIWLRLERLFPLLKTHHHHHHHLTNQVDLPALSQRVETLILHHLSLDGQSRRLEQTELLQWKACYTAALRAYILCRADCSITMSPELFNRILLDTCLSRLEASDAFRFVASLILSSTLRQPHAIIPAYCFILCQSPFLSIRMIASLDSCRDYHMVVEAFVGCLTGGHAPKEVVQRCMEHLCTDPERFYTVCRILAMGGRGARPRDHGAGDSTKEDMIQSLARIDPTHTIWTDWAHYMSMDPRDWGYLRVRDEDLDDEEEAADIKSKMQAAIDALDEFFAPTDSNIYTPLDSGSRETNSAAPVEVRRVSRKSRIRRFLGLGSEATSNVVDNFELESGWETGGHWEPAD